MGASEDREGGERIWREWQERKTTSVQEYRKKWREKKGTSRSGGERRDWVTAEGVKGLQACVGREPGD